MPVVLPRCPHGVVRVVRLVQPEVTLDMWVVPAREV